MRMNSQKKFEKFLPYFSSRYTFEVCPKERVEELVRFIDTYWKKDHIFVKSRRLLDWNLFDERRNRYNFCIATEKKTGDIHAIVGFTYTSHFDPAISRPLSWGCLWKAREEVAQPGVGLMVEWMKDFQFPSCAVVGLGESNKAIQLAKKNGAHTGVMDQYFLVNDDLNDFRLLGGEWLPRREPALSGALRAFCEVGEDDLLHMSEELRMEIPCFKSPLYYVNRYLLHPFYTYHTSFILDGRGACIGVLIWRACQANGAVCLRIVDYFGKPGALAGCQTSFQKLLTEQNAEYIDMLCTGMPPDELMLAGFVERHSYPGLIIPNYFEPFCMKNIDVSYSWSGDPTAGRIFKGDSDQDRPNTLEANE